jgi:hypothetical protein
MVDSRKYPAVSSDRRVATGYWMLAAMFFLFIDV